MARLTAVVASSHRSPCRSPTPHRSHSSSSVVSICTGVCFNSASASWHTGASSFSSASSPSAIGGMRGERIRSATTSNCFREERTPHPSPHHRQLLFPHKNLLYHDLLEQNGEGSLGWSWRRRASGSAYCRGMERGAQLGAEQLDLDQEEQEGDPRILALEEELYDFMQKSSKPSHFPTKQELIAAGRMDLVEAIAEHGGWLAYGCDFEDDEAAGTADDYDYDDDGGEGREKGGGLQGGEWTADAISSLQQETDSRTVPMEHNETAVGWQDHGILQQQRVCPGEGSVIEGILNRLEKERNFSYLEADKKVSSKNKDYDLGAAAASQEVPYGNKYEVDNFLSNMDMDDLPKQSVNDIRNRSNEPKSFDGNDQKCIHSHLQFLESQLDLVLSSLRSRTDAVVSHKMLGAFCAMIVLYMLGHESSLMELHQLSDALEFQETEIMNAQEKLRSIHAKLAALEGKMALEILEAQKIVEERQKLTDAIQKALCLLRTAYVVWPNSASEVFLAGSFDGWTSQMLMERSSTGIFFLYLKLYPGKYEIKFIVDGVWRIDPFRPVVYNNGYENNLLVVQ